MESRESWAGSDPTAATRFVDVCNGEADGLCAVRQWRLRHPVDAFLVTGLKRNVDLLRQVQAGADDEVLVCDLSMQRNRPALRRLLAGGARIRYFDHHGITGIPADPTLEVHLGVDAQVCTSLLVDRELDGAARGWAIVGAYGQNLIRPADALAARARMPTAQRARLRLLGTLIDYNAYGDSEQDVRIPPSRLYRIMARHADPLDMIDQEPIVAELVRQREVDLSRARTIEPLRDGARGAIRILPDEPWSRRAMDSLAHELAKDNVDQAQALLRRTASGHYVVSVRAPLVAPEGAGDLCAQFGGDGRAVFAGIDRLPHAELDSFIAAFDAAPWAQRDGRDAPRRTDVATLPTPEARH
jgi:hypothetical protein